MAEAVRLLVILVLLTPAITTNGTARQGTKPDVRVVAIRAFIISADDAHAARLADELNSVLKSPQSTPLGAYLAIKRLVDEQVGKKVAFREWDPDPNFGVSAGERAVLKTTTIPLPPLRGGKSKRPATAPAYSANGTARGQQLSVTPLVDAATGRADRLILRYSATELPNSAAFVHDPHESRPEPKVVADLVPETTLSLPASGGALLSFKTAEEPGRTTLLVIIGAAQ